MSALSIIDQLIVFANDDEKEEKYSKSDLNSKILSDVGLSHHNQGVFNGKWTGNGVELKSYNPATGELIGTVKTGSVDDYEQCIVNMNAVKSLWATTPAPKRGKVIETICKLLTSKKVELGKLISLENGKILSEGMGEVQEAIDICNYAVGLSRTLLGSVIPSERDDHIIFECYNPLRGHVGIITAFNFPVAVFFWNAAISLVCGNTQLWKGSSDTPLITIACTKIIQQALSTNNFPTSIACTITGSGKEIGSLFGNDKRIELISFTGSTATGQTINKQINSRGFGTKSIMECGGNNGQIVMEDGDIDMAIDSIVFGAIGTAGQRCTSLRRLFVQNTVYEQVIKKLMAKYKQIAIKIGNPLDGNTVIGPLINKKAVINYANGIEEIKNNKNSKIIYGGKVLSSLGNNFVEPTIVETLYNESFVKEELFAPILYVMKFKTLDEAIMQHNAVKYGLSSAIFTKNIENMFKWIGPNGSDCGLINVNIGTSGAEIGGAFGGEKQTGHGREAGSDSWKQYMRRSTCTINYSKKLPLAQGIQFG